MNRKGARSYVWTQSKQFSSYSAGSRWDNITRFCDSVGWDIMWDFNLLHFKRGRWDPQFARKFLKYSTSRGVRIPAFQLGNGNLYTLLFSCLTWLSVRFLVNLVYRTDVLALFTIILDCLTKLFCLFCFYSLKPECPGFHRDFASRLIRDKVLSFLSFHMRSHILIHCNESPT